MAKVEYSQPRATYFNVLSDGKFHQEVAETTPGAVRREYETSDGKTGVKYELVAQKITGKIKNLAIYEGDFGKNIIITLDGEGEDDTAISLSANSNFGEDFLKKLPNLDVSKDICFAPYSFEDEKKKLRKGISITQDGEKKPDYYHKQNPKNDKQWDPCNGYPKLPKEASGWDSDDWKLYFGTARKFLLEEFKKHELYDKATRAEGSNAPEKVAYPEGPEEEPAF